MFSRQPKSLPRPNDCLPCMPELIMKRHHYLTLSALYLAAHASLAADVPQGGLDQPSPHQQSTPREDAGDQDALGVMSAIRDEVIAADRLSSQFETFAGSHQNAQNLVAGLRNAHVVKLVAAMSAAGTESVATFLPPTRPMAYGDIRRALTLAQAQLTSKHLTNPTPSQLKAALAGGQLPNANGDLTKVIGILPLHKRGMSWDAIARALRVDAPARMASAALGRGNTQLP